MRFGQVFTGSAFPLIQIRNGVQAQSIDAQLEPEIQYPLNFPVHKRVIVIQIRLMRIEPVPIVSMRQGVPGPVRRLEIAENDARVAVFLRAVAPDIKIPPWSARGRAARALEPGVLLRGVIDHELGYYSQISLMGRIEEIAEILKRAVNR